jgi:hemolysin III
VPALRASIGIHALLLLLVGGLIHTAGALVYAIRRPDPFPTVFGFHEIFHVLVIAAAACHFVVVEAAIRALG